MAVTIRPSDNRQASHLVPSDPVTFVLFCGMGNEWPPVVTCYPPEGKTATGKANLTPKKAGVPYLSCNPFAFTRHTPFPVLLTLMTPYLGRFLCVCLTIAPGLALFLLPKYFHFSCLPSLLFLWVVVKVGQGGVGGGSRGPAMRFK